MTEDDDNNEDGRTAAATATDASEKAQGKDQDAPEGDDQIGNDDAQDMD